MTPRDRIGENFKGIIDSTLREGFQFSRADFRLDEQKRIFSELSAIAVDYVEVGNPVKHEVREMIAALVRFRRPKDPKILCHVRNQRRDIAEAAACGVAGVNILCTVDSERLAAMGRTPSENEDLLVENLGRALSSGLEVRVGVEDAFNQNWDAGLRIFSLAQANGASRISVADTLGNTLPWEMSRRLRRLRRHVSLDIEVHCHNDLGHAVSNALAALQAGANWVSTTLLGIGERTGITPLSSLLANLFLLAPDLAGRYNLGRLSRAEQTVAEICRIEIPPNLITSPANGFAHKAGIHLDALIKFGPHKYEPLCPGVIGNRRHLLIHPLLSGKTRAEDIAAFEKRFGSPSPPGGSPDAA